MKNFEPIKIKFP